MKLTKFAGLALLCVGLAGSAFGAVRTPEIDVVSGMNALALLSGALMVVRGRTK